MEVPKLNVLGNITINNTPLRLVLELYHQWVIFKLEEQVTQKYK